MSALKYRFVTTARNPEIQNKIERLDQNTWPLFLLGTQINIDYSQLYDIFGDYQFAFIDRASNIIAIGNSIPLYWTGNSSDLPKGWDDAVFKGFKEQENGTAGNTLCSLAAIVNPKMRGRGISYEVIKTMCSLAKAKKMKYLIVPVRPTMKEEYPNINFSEYVNKKREDGSAFDPWIRVHQNLGGKKIGYAYKSQLIQGTIKQWEGWTKQTFPTSGEYLVKGGMQPVHIDLEKDLGSYYDLAVWFEHQL